ncbi:hypothetical protein [Paenibacillus sp. LHD-38]|uniref:hypothetical protein n=1 Tax=Paenibacillus sp. LHD-38 TaxID=3072143 RepID=UPI00280FD542|nr:hypothetical protein [Paenibacillus sp. LHD-38]MDQ8737205.1 hypothetical protein [Paenibacillus sp. LHD-38]
MTTSRQHQASGQIEEQIEQQIQAATKIQGESKLDQEIKSAANEHSSEMDEIIEK